MASDDAFVLGSDQNRKPTLERRKVPKADTGPSSDRNSRLAQASKKATGRELKDIKKALEHPRQRPNRTALLTTTSTGVAMILKSLKDAGESGSAKGVPFVLTVWDVVLLIWGIAAVSIAINNYVSLRKAKHPVEDIALEIVNELLTELDEEAEKK